MEIKFGPAGLGGVDEAISNLEEYHRLGIKACEIAFTYGVYIKKKEDQLRIGKRAKELGISLSIHAPYFINLNSKEKEKVESSKNRIISCLKAGHNLGATKVVFHAGFYSGMGKEKAYKKIKNQILELEKIRLKEGYIPKLAPETMGKVNVFGSYLEISRLVRDTGCSFCIDFSHILARDKSYQFETVLSEFKDFEEIHIHFSGIEYTEKGERRHLRTPKNEILKLITGLDATKNYIIISESPMPIEDSLLLKEVLREVLTRSE